MNKNLNTALVKGGLSNINIESSDIDLNIADINKYFENDAKIGEVEIKAIIENMLIDTGGIINIELKEIMSVFNVEGDAFVGLAYETGEDACSKAVENIANAIPKDSSISENAKMMMSFIGDAKIMGIQNLIDIMQDFRDTLDKNIEIYFTSAADDTLNNEAYVFCALSGLNA